jgi:hypothetical protein
MLRIPKRELNILVGSLTPSSSRTYRLRTNRIINITDGIGEIDIEIPSVALPTTGSAYTAENFNVQVTVSNFNATAASVEIGTVVSGDLYTLPITINAAEYASSTWSNLDDPKTVYVTISVV